MSTISRVLRPGEDWHAWLANLRRYREGIRSRLYDSSQGEILLRFDGVRAWIRHRSAVGLRRGSRSRRDGGPPRPGPLPRGERHALPGVRLVRSHRGKRGPWRGWSTVLASAPVPRDGAWHDFRIAIAGPGIPVGKPMGPADPGHGRDVRSPPGLDGPPQPHALAAAVFRPRGAFSDAPAGSRAPRRVRRVALSAPRSRMDDGATSSAASSSCTTAPSGTPSGGSTASTRSARRPGTNSAASTPSCFGMPIRGSAPTSGTSSISFATCPAGWPAFAMPCASSTPGA